MTDDPRYPVGKFSFPESMSDDERKAFVDEIAATPARLREAVAGLSDEQRQRLLGIFRARSWTAGEAIFRAGDVDGTTHLVLDGQVRIADDAGEIGRIGNGQCLGETSLLYEPEDAPAHSADAVAVTDVEVASFDVDEFRRFVRRHPDIGVVIYRNLAADVSGKLHRARAKLGTAEPG